MKTICTLTTVLILIILLETTKAYIAFDRFTSRFSNRVNSKILKSVDESIPPKTDFDTLLQKELSQFQATTSSSTVGNEKYKSQIVSSPETAPQIASIKNVISTLLVADFFLVMVFLAWYILAAVTQSTTPVILERFQDIFQPVVVPSLTVLMAGSMASGLLGNGEKKGN